MEKVSYLCTVIIQNQKNKTMKQVTNKLFKLLAVLTVVSLVFSSCQKDEEVFPVPTVTSSGTLAGVTGATVTNIVFSGITDRRSTIAFIRAALTTAGYLVEDMDKSLVISWSTAGQFIALSGSGVATWTRLIKYNWYASGVKIGRAHV